MVWSKIAPIDGKPRYVTGIPPSIHLTTEKSGRVLDKLPPGWSVKVLSDGNLKLVPPKK